MQIINATALDVKDGDIVYMLGYRCVASEVQHYTPSEADAKHPGEVIARYTLTSRPTDDRPAVLPGGYNGGTYGGNKFAPVGIER
jgi:hypothetical protein